MTDIDRNQAGLTLGIVFGAMHALWVAAVGAEVGGTLLDWLYAIHFASNPHTLTGFDPVTALSGVIAAFISGYVIGWGTALVWNRTDAFL